MKGISKAKVSVVEQVIDGAVLLRNTAVRKLWQKLTEVLPLGIWQYFTPGAFAHHREEYFRLLQTNVNSKYECIICSVSYTCEHWAPDNSHPQVGPLVGSPYSSPACTPLWFVHRFLLLDQEGLLACGWGHPFFSSVPTFTCFTQKNTHDYKVTLNLVWICRLTPNDALAPRHSICKRCWVYSCGLSLVVQCYKRVTLAGIHQCQNISHFVQ